MRETAARLAIITGASSGIGAGVARAARRDGAVVATVSRRPVEEAIHLAIDLADPVAWPAVSEWMAGLVAERDWDDVTFVHSAATLTPIGPAGGVDAAAYQANVLLNSAAPQVLGAAFLSAMDRAEGAGTLMQLSSGAAGTPYAGWSSYCAAKAAVDMWVRTVGLERAERGGAAVRVLSVAPGVVATAMQAEIRASAVSEFPEVERFRGLHEHGALADPDAIGARIWSLAGRDTWASGSVLDLRNL